MWSFKTGGPSKEVCVILTMKTCDILKWSHKRGCLLKTGLKNSIPILVRFQQCQVLAIFCDIIFKNNKEIYVCT